MPPRFSIWMVVAGVVVGVLVGYLAGSGVIGSAPGAMRDSSAGGQEGRKSSRERMGSRVARDGSTLLRDEALPGADLETLDSDGWFSLLFSLHERRYADHLDPLEDQKIDYQISLLISQMPGSAIRDLLERMRASDLQSHRSMRNEIQARLMRRMLDGDPNATLAWAESIEGGKPWMSLALGALSELDPGLAGQVMRERLESGNIERSAFDRQFGSAALGNIARHAARGGLAEFLDFLEWAPSHHNLILSMSDAVPDGQIRDFVEEWRRRVSAGTGQQHELAFFLNHWARVAPDEMKAWFSEVGVAGDASVELADSVGSSLRLVDRSTGLAFYEEQFRGDPEWARELYRRAVNWSPEMLPRLTELLPPEVPPVAEDVEKLTGRLLHNPQDIVTVAGVFRDSQERFRFLEQLLTSESIAETWPSERPAGHPGPNENDLRAVRVALGGLDLDDAQRADMFRMFDAAAFGEGDASAAE